MKKTLVILAALTFTTAHASPFVIYGEDNRLDTIDASSFHQNLASSTAAMVLKEQLVTNGQQVELIGPTLAKRFKLCEDQRFFQQPSVAYCSGFLVAPDVIVTAGHCVPSQRNCEKSSWVFNYKIKNSGDTKVTVTPSDVYQCVSVIESQNIMDIDFAVIKLDRPVVGHDPVKLAEVEPEIGEPLVIIGHPSGLPQKVADGATVLKKSGNIIKANLDAFQINSGSAVFHDRTGELVGILVNGETDYRRRAGADCVEVNPLENKRGSEGVSLFKQFAQYIPK